jgi:hypothetical protein
VSTEADVRRICLALPEVAEKPWGGLPGFRVRDRLFARIRVDPDALVVWRPDIAEKEALIAVAADRYFQTPHYHAHPAVLVRLEGIEVDELAEVITDSWLLRAPVKLVRAFDPVAFVTGFRDDSGQTRRSKG